MRCEIGTHLPQDVACPPSVEPIRCDSHLVSLLEVWNGSLHVVPCRLRCWLYDYSVVRSKESKALSFALVSTGH